MTKKCTSCQKDIDVKAKKCPHCNADQRNWFSLHPVITGIVALIIIFGIIAVAHLVTKNAGLSNQTQLDQNQPTPTTVRHDNSGAGSGSGTDTGRDTSIQGHMQHALQHFGL